MKTLILITVVAAGQLSNASDQETVRAERLEYMKHSVEVVELDVGVDGTGKLTLVEEPVQRWSNPVAGIPDATVFVWTKNGRPIVAAQIFELFDGRLWQEFQSLSTEPLLGRHGEERFWQPANAGIKWTPAPNARPPAKTAAGRLVQMRAIARQFSVTDLVANNELNKLRLLSNLLYRYTAEKEGALDGAVFSFVHGTNPETIVVAEGQRQQEVNSWLYGFLPVTVARVEATIDGRNVWSRPLEYQPKLQRPYTAFSSE